MIEVLQPKDIKNFLKRASVAIELDQVYVDALPSERFAREYNDIIWRLWRRDHRSFINKLLSTADAIPPATLRRITRIAVVHEPARIGGVIQDLFAEVVGGCCSVEDLATADQFFGCVIEQLPDRSKNSARQEGARASIFQWLPLIDPLRIAQDPECRYGVPVR